VESRTVLTLNPLWKKTIRYEGYRLFSLIGERHLRGPS